MSDVTQTPTLEQTLNKTDLGHVIYEKRKLFLGLLLAILLGAVGYALWMQSKQSRALQDSAKVFNFQSTVWTEAKSGKMTPQELAASFGKLEESIRSAPVMLPLVMEMSKFLYDKGAFAEAESILSQVKLGGHSVSAFFLNNQRAVVFEKPGKLDEAIKVLEELAQSKEPMMPAKVSLDLGRLYALKGEKGKAQTQFEYVLTSFPNDGQAKLAKLYLSQLPR